MPINATCDPGAASSLVLDGAKTAWFAPDNPPVHEGVYQRQFPGGPYTLWDGATWRADASTAGEAASKREPSSRQDCPWRGLAERPGHRDTDLS